MFKRLAAGGSLLLASHVALSIAPVFDALPRNIKTRDGKNLNGQQTEASDRNENLPLSEKDRQHLEILITNLYSGKNRYARIPYMYDSQAKFESPLMSFKGGSLMTSYYRIMVAGFNPVQLNSDVLPSSNPKLLTFRTLNEYTFAGIYTRKIPIDVEIILNDEGLIVSQVEVWDGHTSNHSILGLTRSINGWLFSKMT